VQKIPLTRGLEAIVDDEDYPELAKHRWLAMRSGKSALTGEPYFYAMRSEWIDGKQKATLMHRQIMCAPKGLEVDHANGDRLDNRKGNLRLATRAQNRVNSLGTTQSGYKGVYQNKNEKTYFSFINRQGKRHYVGCFKTADEAAAAYNQAAQELHGEFAVLNELPTTTTGTAGSFTRTDNRKKISGKTIS
jgi:hypothetical protein